MVGITRIEFDVNPDELFRNFPEKAYTRAPTTYETMKVNGNILVPEENAITLYDKKKIEKAVEKDLRRTFGEDYERMIGSVEKQLRIDKGFRNKLGLGEDYIDRTKIISVSSLPGSVTVTLLLNEEYANEVLQYLDALETSARAKEKSPLYANAREIKPTMYQVPIKREQELPEEQLEKLEKDHFPKTTERGLPGPQTGFEDEDLERQVKYAPVGT